MNVKNGVCYRDLEKSVGFTYRHIRGFFRKTARISLSHYILARRIANAAFEIRHSVKSITDIAFEYEFSNADTFTRAFSRCTGLTPSEFRRSGHLCGRRIICQGVYAPVILDLDNPRFMLPKFMEVNEMGEMVKTSDSCVLYGVTKVYYGREIDGHWQGTPFPMCLQAVLNYMGQNINYAEIIAASGAAFRQRWNVNGWDFSAVDIRNTYYEHLKPFELAFQAAGRGFKIVEEADKSKAKSAYLEIIKPEIDCGRPVIALGVVGPPEACIITGYKNNGETLLGWSLFQYGGPFGGDCGIDESGYFFKDNWWEHTEAVMSVREEIDEYASLKEILKNAYTLMKQDKVETYEGKDPYYCGQAAFEAWAGMIDDDSNFAEGVDLFEAIGCQGDQEVMLGEGRDFASVYMVMLAERYPALRTEFSECARLFADEAKTTLKMHQARGGYGMDETTAARFREKQTRDHTAGLIRQAARYENEACIILGRIIELL